MTDKKEPIYAKAPGRGKKPMILRAAKASMGIRSKNMKITLPTLKSMEEKK
jgi:hypothetical protein